jgi:hypothetical protein
MEERAKEVVRQGDKLFGDKQQVDSLNQEIALNFYNARADFTVKRNQGEEYSEHTFSSYPSLARREFCNMLSEMMRPDKWLSIHVEDEELDESDAERAFLEKLTGIQWRAMTDARANLVTAAGQTDHDFGTFGNGVLDYGRNMRGDALLFRNHHLRDVVWSVNAEMRVDCVHRNWAPTARQLKHHFRDKISGDVKKACEKDPEKTFRCRHVVMPSRLYDYKTKGGKQFPFVSLYVECETETVLEEAGQGWLGYTIPRWQVVSGSVYGRSMATDILLPDGRTMQVMVRTIREAGEKYVDPPMIAVGDAIRGDVALYAGGITNVDMEYDERLGEVLRPITHDRGGMPIGMELAQALKDDINRGWFLDKIKLPETGQAKTATEIRRIIQEHIRSSAPITKPIQKEYNDPLCDGVFQILLADNVFPMDEMPESLDGMELKFKFRSPLDELAEQNEADIFVDGRDRILMPSAQLDPSILETADLAEGTRDALRASGWKAKWFKPREAVASKREQDAQEQQAMAMAQEASTIGQVAEQGGKGLDALVQAGNNAMQPPMPQQPQMKVVQGGKR